MRRGIVASGRGRATNQTWLNAQADRTRFTNNATRQHMYGGSLGNAIVKNKLFNFFSLERWRVGYPGSFVSTVPTAAERTGDFSALLNVGSIYQVYDPLSGVAARTVTRSRPPATEVRAIGMRVVPASVQLLRSGEVWMSLAASA